MQDEESRDIYAALDLGSNSFHLLLARFHHGHLVVVDRYKDMVRLASGLGDDGRLDPVAIERALHSLEKFAERIRPLSPERVRVVGTNTLRAASNGDGFLLRAEAILGVPVSVISGVEEARLIYLGVASDVAPDAGSRLVVDIGGGSTELVLGGDQPLRLESLYMGCVSYSRRFFPEGRLSRRRYQRALIEARSEIQGVASQFGSRHWREAIGSSGTIRAIERVLDRLGLNRNHVITAEGLEALVARLLRFDHFSEIELPGLDAQRREVFVGGVAVLQALFIELGIGGMQVSARAIREGMLYDLAGRLQHRDKRQETIEQMMQQYHVDRAQVVRVEALALRLFEQVRDQLDTGPELAQRLLRWAVSLHELGLAISHNGYHRHGAYILNHGDMAGFSRQEQRQLGFLVLNHRRKPSRPEQRQGQPPDWRLAIVLRLACLFLRRRDEAAVPPELSLRFAGETCQLGLPAGWLEAHPLTAELLRQEARQLRAVGLRLKAGARLRD